MYLSGQSSITNIKVKFQQHVYISCPAYQHKKWNNSAAAAAPVTKLVTRLVPVPEEIQLPSPTSSEEEAIPVPPLHATTPGHEVSGQRCWMHRKFDKTPGAGASSRFFWCSSGLPGQGRARPYPAGRGEARGSSGDWHLRVEQHAGPSEPPATSHWPEHGPICGSSSRAVQYGWKSLSPGGSP